MEVWTRYEPTDRQREAHLAPERYKLYGGAMGGGKSRWLCEEVKELCLEFPGNRALMCRLHLSDFKDTTLKTLLECLSEEFLLPGDQGHNKSEGILRFRNGSEILYRGLSEVKDVTKLKSMEIGVFAFDEASEIAENYFHLASSRLRRILPDGRKPRYFGLLTSNPEDCWLKDKFVDGKGGEEFVFIPALPKDNPHLPDDYESRLRKTFPDDYVDRFLDGNWDSLAEGNNVLPREWIDRAVGADIAVEDKPCMGVDVARFGDDETVIYCGYGGKVMDHDIATKRSTDETALRVQRFITQYDVQRTCIDDIGVGGGVTDFLSSYLKLSGIDGVNVGTRSEDDRFFNKRAEIWWLARDMFENNKVSLPNDEKLIRQLASPKYRYRATGKIIIEPKEETKARISVSPDRADALVLMLYASRGLREKARDYERVVDLTEITQDPYGWDVQGVPNQVWAY